jgi:FtsH-binding integral membrane protein
MSEQRMKPIWFFVGLMLLVMGSITLIAGIYEAINPPMTTTVLAETHPGIWWGAIMAVFGGMMFLKTRKESV